MVKAPSFDGNGMKKGAWSEDEDKKLRAHITAFGHRNWRLVPIFAGLARCGKSCRLRWVNYLRPGLRRGNFTEQEKDLIIRLHDQLGNKWSVIAENLPGRTDNEVKNYWHARISKRIKRNLGTVNKVVTTKSSHRNYGITANDDAEEHVRAQENVSQVLLLGLSVETYSETSIESTYGSDPQAVDSHTVEGDIWTKGYETCYNQYFELKNPRPASTQEELMQSAKGIFSDSLDSEVTFWYSTEESPEPLDDYTFDVVLW